MEENNDIFLTGGDALEHLAEPIHKKYSTKLFLGNRFGTHVSYDRLFNSPPTVHTCTIFDDLPFIPPVVYVINGWSYLSTKKQITTFQYRIH